MDQQGAKRKADDGLGSSEKRSKVSSCFCEGRCFWRNFNTVQVFKGPHIVIDKAMNHHHEIIRIQD